MSKTGKSYTRTYASWKAMRNRCRTKYAGRFTIDPRWDKYENFLADMGECPAGMTLDRQENAKGYSKENCRWATPQQQANNTRRNIYITREGVTRSLKDWAREFGLSYWAVLKRYQTYGDFPELFAPVRSR